MKETKTKLIFIEQFFHPEGWSGADIPKEIVLALLKDGWDITVFCGDRPYVKPYRNDKNLNKKFKNIKIKKIKIPFNQTKFFKKIINQIIFSLEVFFQILIKKDSELIVLQTNPPLIVVIIALISWIKKNPFIIISMDIYPDVLIKTKDKKYSYLIKFFLNPIFKYSYKKADKVIALGNQMQKILIKKNVDNSKIKIIPNWATGDLKVIKSHSQNKLYKEWGIFSKIRIIYSGNLGIAHDWETLLKALRISKLPPKDIQIIFISNGKRIKDAMAYSNKFLFKNSVIFKDLVEPALLPYSMGLANLACVSIRSSYGGLVAPSKFPGYLARGLPVIYVGPNSDISEILNNKIAASLFK